MEWRNPAQVHPGSIIAATVLTSENVGYVEARVRYWNVIFKQVAPGKFETQYRVPFLPPSALGVWHVLVIARSVDGVEIKRTYQFDYSYF